MTFDAFRSQNYKEIIIVHELNSIGSRIYMSPIIAHYKAKVLISHINEQTIYNDQPPHLADMTVVVNGEEDNTQHIHLLYENQLYNYIDCSNQLKEMLSGTDPDAKTMAYDILRLHSKELVGSPVILSP